MRALAVTLLALLVATARAEPVRTEAAGLRFAHPSEWTRVPAPSDMRAAQFRVAKADGDAEDAEVVLFFFGKGQGGSAQDNLDRWRGQMGEGASAKAAGTVTIKTIHGLKVTSLDVAGTYKPMARGGDATPHPGYRLLAAVIEGEGGPWFLRLVGPEATVKAAKPGFDATLESVETHP